jgi:hypothetical protein
MFLETSGNPSLSLSLFLALCVSLCLSLSLSLSHSLSHSHTHTHSLFQMSTVLSANKMKSHDLATWVFLFVYIAVFDFRHPFPVILGMVYSRVYHMTVLDNDPLTSVDYYRKVPLFITRQSHRRGVKTGFEMTLPGSPIGGSISEVANPTFWHSWIVGIWPTLQQCDMAMESGPLINLHLKNINFT